MAHMGTQVLRKDNRSHTRSAARKVNAAIMALRFSLPVNANTTQTEVSDHTGDVSSVQLCLSALATGMTIDVQVAGASILKNGTPLTLTANHLPNTIIAVPLEPNKRILPGQLVSVIRGSFVAGASVVQVMYAPI